MPSVSHQPALTIDEVAALLNISRNTVRNQIARGKLHSFTVGERGVRITPEELERYKTEQARGVAAKV